MNRKGNMKVITRPTLSRKISEIEGRAITRDEGYTLDNTSKNWGLPDSNHLMNSLSTLST